MSGYETLVWAPDTTQCPGNCIRPVGLAFDRLGRLFVTSDTTGEVCVALGEISSAYIPLIGFRHSKLGCMRVMGIGLNLHSYWSEVGNKSTNCNQNCNAYIEYL